MKKNILTTHHSPLTSKTGFSLIEILIVIFLLGVALVGVLSFFNSSIISHTDAKNELIAAGLAQEGPELVRNLADWKKLQPTNNSWTDVKTLLLSCNRIDYRSLTSHSCQNNTVNDYICYSGVRYQQCDSGTTDMKRTVSIQYKTDATSGNRLEITSTVTWNDRTTTAIDRLYENEY